MTSSVLRQKFLIFFKEKGHKVIPSSSLVPQEPDITESDMTLFTSAGMQQFKRFYANPNEASYSRAASAQKCLRTADIDEVGDDIHLSFFEMLGNFSFGYPKKEHSYFKEDAINWAWEFLTKTLAIPKSRLHATYFKGENGVAEDKESLEILQKIDGLEEIKPQGFADNFWSLGSKDSPGGPTVEFHIDGIEVWNLVFNEYVFRDGKYVPSEFKGVDTGMGFERLLTTLDGHDNVYQTDLFQSIIKEIEAISGKKYTDHPQEFRIIADHLKAAIFAIADGVEPSNKGAGYIVRRLIRRAIIKGQQLGITENFLTKLAKPIFKIYETDNHLDESSLATQLDKEETKFRNTLQLGLKQFEKTADLGKRVVGDYPFGNENHNLSGKELFDLYQTYGFPLELSLEIINDSKIPLDPKAVDDFNQELKKHQDLSRTASAGMFKGGLADASEQTTKLHTAAHLLLAALRKVLGDHVTQKGSNITAERLRFDFSHPEKMTPEQIKQAEDLVNEQIDKDLPVTMQEMTVDEAKESGAMGVFEHKYGDKVKVYTIGKSPTDYFSKEICGGPHVTHTGELGHLKITKEESSSSGIRRIKAILE